jgi:hypothetical protein
MTAASRQRGQVLILLAAWLFFAGGGSSAVVAYDRPVSEVKKAIKRTITDASRKQEILAELSQWEDVQKIHDEKVSDDREELLKIMRRKDATPADLAPIMARLDQTFDVMDWDFLNLRFGVKEQVTKEQWAGIVARPND